MATKTKMLKFGGPGLPPGTHTWYERLRPADVHGAAGLVTVMVYPGDLVPAAVVCRDTGAKNHDACKPCRADLACGVPVYAPAAKDYVDRDMATLVDMTEDEAAAALTPAQDK